MLIRRRNWSKYENQVICTQMQVPDVSVAQVARRSTVNPNQAFNWRKEPPSAAAADENQKLPVTREPKFWMLSLRQLRRKPGHR
ncbi:MULTISPECIES: transposase [Phaeobacter]|uniref:transposase n=2 Tax=Phaeobacter TaxID=302485 RepID=UPI0009E3E2AF